MILNMRYHPRELEPRIIRAFRHFPVVVLTGPRRSGKTSLLRHLFSRHAYVLLEDPDVLARVRADPRGFLADLGRPVILDEIQNAPELLPYIRTEVDAGPTRKGRFLLTGSQDISLMKGLMESLAGRAAVFQLLPFSFRERGRWDLLRGGFPEVLARPSAARIWFSSYLQTYLERDVRAITAVRDLVTFRRFLSLLATRHGRILNKTEFAGPLGVSVPTISHWLNVLEMTGQILLVPPFFENFSKRLLKSSKLYWIDSGLACHLLGIESVRELNKSPFLGAIFEGFLASEIVKNQINQGRRREIYFFRDQQGLEVDFVLRGRGEELLLVEAKSSRTINPMDAKPLAVLARVAGARPIRAVLVSPRAVGDPAFRALLPGVEALSVEEFLEEFASGPH